MAYQTGAASSPADLLAKLRSFAEEVGWTTTAANASVWAFRSAQGGDFTIRISSTTPQDAWELHGSTGNIVGVLDPKQQPGDSVSQGLRGNVAAYFVPGSGGPYTRYHFFGTLQYLHVALEIQSGVFGHAFVGTLDKKGMNYSGGQYLQGSYFRYPHGTIFQTVNSPYGNWTTFGPTAPWSSRQTLGAVRVGGFAGFPDPYWMNNTLGIGKGPYSNYHPDQALTASCKSNYLRKPLIVPNRVLVPQLPVTLDSRLIPLGDVPDFGITDISRNAPGDVLLFGQDEWMVFPAYRRGPEHWNYSVDVGYAYLLRR